MGSICRRRISSSATPSWAAPHDAEAVAGSTQWLEEGQTLDVVPVGVGEQDVRLDGPVASDHELVAERTQPASRIQDDETSVGSGDAHARRVAAVSGGLRARAWESSRGCPRT